jgi:pantoate--beta-alanine ligase
MQLISTAREYEGLHRQWTGKSIALVPTMGALHEGHVALIRRARMIADVVVVSIFVNPLQFGPSEDLNRYPRPIEQDMALCQELGVDVVFHPTVETMYPDGLQDVTTVVPPSALTDRLCGAHRPGHFTGVATVVLKLFNIIRPTMAVFGEKDAQQLAVIRKMVRDLHLPVEIVAHPTVREEGGLALSSRNRYLQTEDERHAALTLSAILNRVREKAGSAGSRSVAEILAEAQQEILSTLNGRGELLRIQYLEAVDRETFASVKTLEKGAKILIAAYVGNVRLIDNIDI